MLLGMQQELCDDEGTRLLVYDDASGHRISAGSWVEGHPTIGIGRCLDLNGITQSEAEYLLTNDIQGIEARLASFSWFNSLDAVRQGVMVNLAFNMGVGGLTKFRDMIGACIGADFDRAADGLSRSRWATQVQKSRSTRLISQLRGGLHSPTVTQPT